MKDSLLVALVAACFIVLTVPDLAEAEIDKKRMRRDLSIMEDVLKSLYRHANTSILGTSLGTSKPRVRGMYFENYGVVVLIEDRNPGGIIGLSHHFGLKAFMKQLEDFEDTRGSVFEEKARKLEEEGRAAQENRIAEFLGNYADAIRQLKEEDRVAVLLRYRAVDSYGVETRTRPYEDSTLVKTILFAGRDSVVVETVEDQGVKKTRMFPGKNREMFPEKSLDRLRNIISVPAGEYYEVSAKKRDIVEYRSERIGEEEFRQRLVVREHKPDDSRMKKIQILSVILDNSLKRTDQLVPNFGTRTLSMYYEGLGAVFFMNAGHGYWEIHPLTTKQGAAEVETRERFREKLIEVVGDYGYTLRTLGPEEYMVVDVRFPAGWESNPGLVLKVRKKDVDAFSREEMDFEEFRRKVEILEF